MLNGRGLTAQRRIDGFAAGTLAAVFLLTAGCAPHFARVVSGDPHRLSELSVVVRPAPKFKRASPLALGIAAGIGGGIGYGMGLAIMLGAHAPAAVAYGLTAAGAAIGISITELARVGEVQGDTVGLNVARMAAERFMDQAPKQIRQWPKMNLVSVPFGLPVESLPCPRIQFGTRDFTTGPNRGLTCAITTQIFDDRGALIYRHETGYNTSERGRLPLGGGGLAALGVVVGGYFLPPDIDNLLVTGFYRKEMQECADYVTSDLIRSLK